MKSMPSVALIGDYNPTVIAHKAIPAALGRAAAEGGLQLNWTWVHTSGLGADVVQDLGGFSALWCVPASPYANTAGAVAAIRFARDTGRLFLGTCGGFQHALLDYAEAVWGLSTGGHAELDPEAPDPVIAQLDCALVEATGEVWFTPGSRLATIYGGPRATETYHCRYGLNPRYAARLGVGPLRVSARDGVGDVRAVELEGHPFFVATLYQPERAALTGRSHPLIAAYVAAASAWV
jgi:CTP synthase (UTP-ammonia lyase)